MPLVSGQFTIHVHPTGCQGRCRRRGFLVVGRFKRIDCCSLNRLARRRLYLVLPSIGGWRLSHMCRSRQNTNTDVNKPIQIQNSLAKSPPWSAGIDMDRSFCALVELRHCVGGDPSPPLRCRSFARKPLVAEECNRRRSAAWASAQAGGVRVTSA